MEYVISASYGNDSVAMIRWAFERELRNVTVAYCQTGWAAPYWETRVQKGEALARRLGFETVRCVAETDMATLVKQRKGFPSNQHQFCTGFLKGLPFIEWIEEADPSGRAVVMIGKRRDESIKRRTTPEIIGSSAHHGGRKVWHPLVYHSEAERDDLLRRAGFDPLPHRSRECSPCVNANRADFLALTPGEIERVNDLEVAIGKPMFRPKRFGAMGIHGVVQWAKHGRSRGSIEREQSDCEGLFGCGT